MSFHGQHFQTWYRPSGHHSILVYLIYYNLSGQTIAFSFWFRSSISKKHTLYWRLSSFSRLFCFSFRVITPFSIVNTVQYYLKKAEKSFVNSPHDSGSEIVQIVMTCTRTLERTRERKICNPTRLATLAFSIFVFSCLVRETTQSWARNLVWRFGEEGKI